MLLYLLVELFVQVLVWWQCDVMGASIRWWWEKAHKSPTGGREKEDYHITVRYWESWAKKKNPLQVIVHHDMYKGQQDSKPLQSTSHRLVHLRTSNTIKLTRLTNCAGTAACSTFCSQVFHNTTQSSYCMIGFCLLFLIHSDIYRKSIVFV